MIAKIFPNIWRYMYIQAQEVFRTKADMIRTSPHHIIITIPGVSSTERILKAAKKKHQLIYEEKCIE
jgi:hypothetical protein